MKAHLALALAAGCLIFGIALGVAARTKEKAPGIEVIRGKPPKEAAMAALEEAQKLAGTSSWEVLGVARVYYLSGDKARGQALIDQVVHGKPEASDWQRIGQIYAEANENPRAEEAFQKVLAADPKASDDTGRAEIGAWYIRVGQRDKGKELGYRVLLSFDPARALDRYRQQPFDALIVDAGITDPQLPYLAAQLRGDVNVGLLPLIVTTTTPERVGSLERLLERYPNTWVIPATSDVKDLKSYLAARITQAMGKPLTDAERARLGAGLGLSDVFAPAQSSRLSSVCRSAHGCQRHGPALEGIDKCAASAL